MALTNLEAIYDRRKSFYGKAKVEETENGKKLYSYGTLVAEIVSGETLVHDMWWKARVYGFYSDTTLRHIKEFLKQNGFRAETKAQIEKDYFVEEGVF